MWHDEARGIHAIVFKDMKTYYLKPPAVSWGIVFPVAWILAFYLRNPRSFEELVPGLIAMTILFSTTAAEAVVINFELRLGSLERLILTPVSITGVLLGKVIGGALFGFLMTVVITTGSALILGIDFNVFMLLLIIIPSLLVFSSLGALVCVSVREVFEAQTLLNLPRFLMVFLSGVVYPVSAMPAALQHIAHFLPLTYAVSGIRSAFVGDFNMVILNSIVLLGFFVLFIFPAIRLLGRRFE